MSSVVSSSTVKKSGLSGRKAAFVFAIVAAVASAILVFAIMSAVTSKETYYVLNQDVPARTLITPSMLSPVEASAGSSPKSALGLSDLADRYSLYSLKSGDILTSSNVGDQVGLGAGLPKNFVLSSFIANPSVAAGGNIKRGDYVDIMVVANDSSVTGSEGTAASYVLQRVLVVDATLNLDSYDGGESKGGNGSGQSGQSSQGQSGDSSQSNVGGAGARGGIPTMFTVGLSPENAAVLAVASKFELFVVLSSAQTVNDGTVPPTSQIPPVTLNSIWGNPKNAGEGTDRTFGNGGAVDAPSGGNSNGNGSNGDTGVSRPTPSPSTSPTGG